MSTNKGRALNRREANALARTTIGPLAFVEFRRHADPAPGAPAREYLIREMITIGDTRTHGISNRSFREAFHNAGIFWEE